MHHKTSQKKHGRWSSSNHRSPYWSLWRIQKRKVQETSFPIFKIKGENTTRSCSFWSGWNASSLHWRIQIYHHLLRWLFFIWDYVLPQKEKWRICYIQTIQNMGWTTAGHHIKMQMIRLRRRAPVIWVEDLYGREWNRISNVHARYSATKWTSGKVPANRYKWSWDYVASHWLIQWWCT